KGLRRAERLLHKIHQLLGARDREIESCGVVTLPDRRRLLRALANRSDQAILQPLTESLRRKAAQPGGGAREPCELGICERKLRTAAGDDPLDHGVQTPRNGFSNHVFHPCATADVAAPEAE